MPILCPQYMEKSIDIQLHTILLIHSNLWLRLSDLLLIKSKYETELHVTLSQNDDNLKKEYDFIY